MTNGEEGMKKELDEHLDNNSSESDGHLNQEPLSKIPKKKNNAVVAILAICCAGVIVFSVAGGLFPDVLNNNAIGAFGQLYTLEGYTSNHTFKIPDNYQFVDASNRSLAYSFQTKEEDNMTICFYPHNIDEVVNNFRKGLGSDELTITLNGNTAYRFVADDKPSEEYYIYVTNIDGEASAIIIPVDTSNPDKFVERLITQEAAGWHFCISMGEGMKARIIAADAFIKDFNLNSDVFWKGASEISAVQLSYLGDDMYEVTIIYKPPPSEIGVQQKYTVNISSGNFTEVYD